MRGGGCAGGETEAGVGVAYEFDGAVAGTGGGLLAG